MAETLKNIIELIEPETAFQETIKNRIKSIKSFKNFGPPDICYLTKEFQKSLSFSKQTNKSGFLHYIYGLDVSSPAAVSAYLKKMLQLQEKEKTWFSNGRWKITRGLFCIYDVFSKVDIHVEIAIPGGMKYYGYKNDETLISVDENLWERGYISSILRFMNLEERKKAFKIYDVLNNKDYLQNFLHSYQQFHLYQKGYSYNLDSGIEGNLQNLGNKPIFTIINYLMKRKLADIAKGFLEKIVVFDPKISVFMSLIYENLGKLPEAIENLAKSLFKHPHTIVLLYKQAQLLLKFRKIDLALTLAKIIVQLNPESFEAWMLLNECYFSKKNYTMVLLTMNSTPITPTTSENSTLTENFNLLCTAPEEKKESNLYEFCFTPNENTAKFIRFSEELLLAHQEYLEENERLQQRMERLSFIKLEPQEKKLYEFLVRVETQLGWDKLLSLRGELFYMESDSNHVEFLNKNQEDYVIDYKEPEKQEDEQPNNNVNEDTDDEQEHPLPSFLQNEEDNDEQIRKLKNKLNVINKETNKTLNLWDQRRPKKITELSNETFETEAGQLQVRPQEENLENIPEINEENKGDLTKDPEKENEKQEEPEKEEKKENPKNKLETNAREIQNQNPHETSNLLNKETKTRIVNDPTKKIIESFTRPIEDNFSPDSSGSFKRLCSKTMDSLFLSLFEDLNTFYEWEAEDGLEKDQKKAKQNEDLGIPQFNGIIWVHRGLLAERLQRDQAAEIAYRKAVEAGFNYFAWYRLINLYRKEKTWKAVIVCVGEITEEIEHEGISLDCNLPRWIEEVILECLDDIGNKKFVEIIKEINFKNDALNKLLRDYESSRIGFKN